MDWTGLVALMVEVPAAEPAVRGSLRSYAGKARPQGIGWASFEGQPRPVFTGHTVQRRDPELADATGDEEDTACAVWRLGHQLRIESAAGVALIIGVDSCWQFRDPGNGAPPVESPAAAVAFHGNATELLQRKVLDDFVGDDFTRPTGAVQDTEFLGRPAYTVELAPPAHKPHPVQLVVDAGTGLVLQQRNDGFGSVDEWTTFVVGEALDPALFTWTGPAVSWREERAARDRAHEDEMRRREQWFHDHVATEPLTTEIALDLILHVYDEATGAFEATLGGDISLARRPQSDTPWELHMHGEVTRWSDDVWDWALMPHRPILTARGLAALQAQFGGS